MPGQIQPEQNAKKIRSSSDNDTETDPAWSKESYNMDVSLQLLKPVIVTMSLFGLIFHNCKKSQWFALSKAYSIFVLFLLFAGTIQIFWSYRDLKLQIQSLYKYDVGLWHLECIVNAVVVCKACHSDSLLPNLLSQWSRLQKTNRGRFPDDRSFDHVIYGRYMKRKFIWCVVVAWLLVIQNYVCTPFLFSATEWDARIAPVQPSSLFAIPLKCLVFVLKIYATATWVFSLLLFSIITSVIYKEFEIFNHDFRKAVIDNRDIATVEWFRQRHHTICEMVETADDILRGFNAGSIVFATTHVMLILYALVWDLDLKTTPWKFVMYCLWLSVHLSYVLVISYGGGILNHMAHASLKTIHSMKIIDDSPKYSFQMNLFIGKLTGPSVGLTALDMFVIHKPTILTIIGAFITYFIVLVQFHQTVGSAGSCPCNCTDAL